jgi:hypothetical protein
MKSERRYVLVLVVDVLLENNFFFCSVQMMVLSSRKMFFGLLYKCAYFNFLKSVTLIM